MAVVLVVGKFRWRIDVVDECLVPDFSVLLTEILLGEPEVIRWQVMKLWVCPKWRIKYLWALINWASVL